MSNSYFEILRPGINTTIQDKGRNHLYHIGIAVSGAIDQRNYKLANTLVGNQLDEAVIEFAYQGPLLKLSNGRINFVITGDVFFNIVRKNSNIEKGECYKNYILEGEDQIDIISTKNSAYGYLSVKDGFKLKKKNNADEFLVEKKNPLVLPPNYNELPIPNSETLKEEKSLSFDINLKTESLSKNRNILQEESSSTEQTILKNIKKNDSN